jgi:hypothetical protein
VIYSLDSLRFSCCGRVQNTRLFVSFFGSDLASEKEVKNMHTNPFYKKLFVTILLLGGASDPFSGFFRRCCFAGYHFY